MSAMDTWATIIIPTRNSAVWIRSLIEEYAARGVHPTFVLDERSNDKTEEILRESGLPFHKTGAFPFTEAIVSISREIAKTPWVLWMHDDEFPSEGLFARLSGPEPADAVSSVAVQRRWVWFEPGKQPTYGRSRHWHDRTDQPGADHCWRLFRPDRVTYVSIMHTEGFLIEKWSRLQPQCYIAHFEWVIRTRAQREAKLRRYDAYRFGYGTFFRRLYLPEDQEAGVIDYVPCGHDRYDRLLPSYFGARGPNPPNPPLTLHERSQRLFARLNGLRGMGVFRREAKDRLGLQPLRENELADTALPAGVNG